jgi:putative ABC transport system permease protein
MERVLGKRVKFPGNTSGAYGEVVGMIKDFNQKSLYHPIATLILYYRPNSNNLQLKLNGANILQLLLPLKKNGSIRFLIFLFHILFLIRILIRNMLQIKNAERYLQHFQYLLF